MQYQVSFDTSDVNEKIKDLIAKYPVRTLKVLHTSATAVLIPAIKQQVKENKSVFRGELHQRMASRTSVHTKRREPKIEVGALGVPYGTIIEKGSEPRLPTKREKEKIVEWCRKKLGLTKPKARRLAGAIMYVIIHDGNKAHPYLLNTWRATKDQFWKDFTDRMRA